MKTVYCEATECHDNAGGLKPFCTRDEVRITVSYPRAYRKGSKLKCSDYAPRLAAGKAWGKRGISDATDEI